VQFHKALDIDSTYENAVYNLAVTYVRWGTELNKEATDKGVDDDSYKQKYEQALPYLEKSVKLKSTEANVWELLGRVYTVLNMKDKATNAFNEADKLRK
jgi:cytochrome c-type biogenesis protein CcmH/NrfG